MKRKAIFVKTSGRCWYCGTKFGKEKCVDHVIPKSKGGSESLDNLVPCCRSCNSTKGPRTVAYLRKILRMRSAGIMFSQQQIDWLLTKCFDVLRVIPEYKFYFETIHKDSSHE